MRAKKLVRIVEEGTEIARRRTARSVGGAIVFEQKQSGKTTQVVTWVKGITVADKSKLLKKRVDNLKKRFPTARFIKAS